MFRVLVEGIKESRSTYTKGHNTFKEFSHIDVTRVSTVIAVTTSTAA